MKNELIQLAAEKDFKSQFFHPEPLKYSDKEPTRYYLWMCELQKWLRDIHNIHVRPLGMDINETNKLEYVYGILVKDINRYILLGDFENRVKFSTHEKAFEEGLFEALKLIKT